MAALPSLLDSQSASRPARGRLLTAGALVLIGGLFAGPASALPHEDPAPVDPAVGAPAVSAPAAPAPDTAPPVTDPSAVTGPAVAPAATPGASAAAGSQTHSKVSKKKSNKRKARTSRSLPRAGAPAASQRYAKAYIAQKYGWGAGQFSCLKVMWTKESGWKYWVSNPNGIYHGIPQTSRHEWTKDGYTAGQYMHSPAVQIRVGARYIKSRYGSPCGAWAFWRNHHWY
jgi:hypothetical protein